MIIFTKLFACLTFLAALSVFANAQNASGDWTRVQSDNGEFSIEVPKTFNYFYDKDGFWTAKDSNDYKLENMSLLNSFHQQTLLSFEVYQAKKEAINALFESDKQNAKSSELTFNNVKYKQTTKKTDEFYFARRYFYSKKFIYILTVGSRSGETPAAKRFFESVIFKPDTKETPDAGILSFSKIKVTPIRLGSSNEKYTPYDPKKKPTQQPTDDDPNKLLVFHRPRATYTEDARRSGIIGIAALQVTFSADGFVPAITILKPLPGELMRQVIFAALRLKFIPKEEEGKAVSSTKKVEYAFSIY